jgi:large exoprotein involved in heme utilization and adhesion
VQLIETSSINPSIVSVIGTVAYSSGDAGDVAVSTQELTLLNGGNISSSTFGTGDGGDVTVNALDSIKVIGQSSLFIPSNLAAVTLGAGDAGQLTVNTSRLVIQDGGAVSTSTLSTGSAGSLTINASESVEVSGRPPVPFLPSLVGSSAPITSDIFRQIYRLPPTPSGFSGNFTINTKLLSVTDGATVEVSNQGVGNAGTLTINANSIFLDTRGAITAATASGEGGNIELKVQDVLLLRNNSLITASADGTGNGGNIRINTSSLVAVPNENSDIRADSVNARGGNVTINTSGLFGIEFRPQDTPLSDITATGASSELSGTVEINVQDVDPARGLTQLPTEVVDASDAIATSCPASQGNSFVVTGRGGLPPNPEQQLDDDAEWLDRRRLTVALQTYPRTDGSRQLSEGRLDTQHPVHHPPLIEATGWEMAPTGQVILTASAPNVTSPHRWGQPVNCDGS